MAGRQDTAGREKDYGEGRLPIGMRGKGSPDGVRCLYGQVI